MKWKVLLNWVASAAIGGAATSTVNYLMDPQHADLHHLGPAAASGAILGVAMLLRQNPGSPLPTAVEKQDGPPPPTISNFPQSK